MASPKYVEFSDYEVMFKRHIHDNLLLNSDLRLLDEMKKSKLRELKRNKDLFTKRFSKYSKTKAVRSLPDVHYTGNSTPRASAKPSFTVCKNSPCSFKTWNNLTDITKERTDVYRTEVLHSEESEVSFRKKTANNSSSEENVSERSALQTDGRRRESAALFRSHSSIMKSSHDVVNVENSADAGDDFLVLPDFRQRACTMPSYCYKTKGAKNGVKADAVMVSKHSCENRNDSKANETISDENHQENALKGEETSQSNLTRPNVFVTDSTPENVVKTADNELRVTFDLGEQDQHNTDQATPKKHGNFKFQRAKSLVIQRDRGDLNMFRRRSYTLDSSKSKPKDLGKLLAKRESMSMNKLDMAVRRLSLFDKLVTTNMSSAENDSDAEWSSSFEDVQSCRYLRVPGQSVHGSKEDLNLENVTF